MYRLYYVETTYNLYVCYNTWKGANTRNYWMPAEYSFADLFVKRELTFCRFPHQKREMMFFPSKCLIVGQIRLLWYIIVYDVLPPYWALLRIAYRYTWKWMCTVCLRALGGFNQRRFPRNLFAANLWLRSARRCLPVRKDEDTQSKLIQSKTMQGKTIQSKTIVVFIVFASVFLMSSFFSLHN